VPCAERSTNPCASALPGVWTHCLAAIQQFREFTDVVRLVAQRVEDLEPQRLGQRPEVFGDVAKADHPVLQECASLKRPSVTVYLHHYLYQSPYNDRVKKKRRECNEVCGHSLSRGNLVNLPAPAANLATYTVSAQTEGTPFTPPARLSVRQGTLASQVSGRVTQVLVRNGDDVKAGQR